MYTEHEINKMESALMLLHDSKQSVEGRLVRNTLRGEGVNVRQLLNEMESKLRLVGKNSDMWYLTSEGETASAMGMKAYLEELERKAKEPLNVNLVEPKFLGLSRSEWMTIAGIAIGLLTLLAGLLG